ncbi:MAG: methyltransferase domain-containing protein [Chitinophagaceae bacterium]|nr:methyltransferase domain-containing protein [Chitinophagaceae bacterium]
MSGYKWRLAQTLEYKWWQRYLGNKDPEQYLHWKKKYWETLLQTISPYLNISPADRIMDAGCGPAGIFIIFGQNQVVAVDPLLDKYRQLPHFDPGQYPNTSFRAIPIEQIDELAGYDVIFCLNAINHVKDISLCYRKLSQALKPGGTLVISTDAHKHNFLRKLFRLIPGDMLHPVQQNIDEYLALLSDQKLELVANILYKKERIFDYYISIARKPA